MHPTYVSDPPPFEPARAAELADRIDPNTADIPTLAALPMIGMKRAQDIVEYREQCLAAHPNELAFRQPRDLMNVHGIGEATVESLGEYLLFPRELTPSPGTPGEGGGEGSAESLIDSRMQQNPHPNPLPEYRERE
jgi:hypothetical protein